MSDDTNSVNKPATADISAALRPGLQKMFGDVGKNWGWILALGILFIVMGMVALGMPVAMTLTTVVFFGALMLVGGIFQIIDAFKCKGWKGVVWHVLIGLLYIAAAIVIFRNPVLSSATLTAMLGGIIAAIGILRIIMGFQMKGDTGWGWLVFAGIVSLVLGGMILYRWPASSLVVIGIIVAVEMIIHGWSYIFVGLAARKARKAVSEATD